MRAASWTMMAVFLAGSVVLAQAPQKLEPLPEKKTPALDPVTSKDDKLSGLLKEWENKMRSVDRFMVDCSRVEIDALKGNKVTYKGEARYLKPNFALLDLKGEVPADPKEKMARELMVSNGEKLYEFRIHEKLVMIHQMPKEGMAEEATFLNFLLGLKSDEVQKRYDLTLKKANDGEGYIYITIAPKLPADKQEFKEAELVLYSKWIGEIKPVDPGRASWAYLPARLWFKAPNGNQSTWIFENYDLKANLQKESFIPPKWPADWKTEVIKPAGPAGPEVKIKDEPKAKLLPTQAPESKLGQKK